MLTEATMAALAAKLLTALPRIEPQATAIISNPVSCVVLTKQDVGSKRYHAFACVDTVFSGDVTGGVLTKSGAVVCDIDGLYDGQCVTLVGCGLSRTACPRQIGVALESDPLGASGRYPDTSVEGVT